MSYGKECSLQFTLSRYPVHRITSVYQWTKVTEERVDALIPIICFHICETDCQAKLTVKQKITLGALVIIYMECVNANVHELHFVSFSKTVIICNFFSNRQYRHALLILEKTGLFFLFFHMELPLKLR